MSMADTDTAIYAVVNKSKKKNRSPPERKAESPVYHVLERDPPPVPAQTEKLESEYPMTSLGSMYSTLCRDTIDTPSTQPSQQPQIYVTKEKAEKLPEKQEPQNKGTNCKSTACILLTIAVVAIVLLICIAYLFVEVVKLQQLQLQNNNNISEFRDDVHTTLTKSIGRLNISFHEQLDTRLNTSIELLFEEVSATLDDYTERIDGLDQLLETVNSSAIDSEMRLVELSRDFQFVAGQFMNFPLSSCAALPPSYPSGNYWVRDFNGSAVRVYCDMTLSCGNITGGWMRVAELDMTDSSEDCLNSDFNVDTSNSPRTCRLATTTGRQDQPCPSVMFPSAGVSYSKVCGRIIAFQKGSPDAFRPSNIDENYLDGISLTHGSPTREHIWSFAAASDETTDANNLLSKCPCILNGREGTSQLPEFVQNNYFCDTGSQNRYDLATFYSDNPLWDGAGCGHMNTCCSFNNPPWFYRQLPQPTTDAIEMRVCRDQDRSDEDIQIQTIDIFVQ